MKGGHGQDVREAVRIGNAVQVHRAVQIQIRLQMKGQEQQREMGSADMVELIKQGQCDTRD
jgi:hypothetical protein